jgi:uncharacterized membrane protein
MKRTRILFVVGLMLIVSLFGGTLFLRSSAPQGAEAPMAPPAGGGTTDQLAAAKMTEANPVADGSAGYAASSPQQAQNAQQELQRLVIKTADLSLQVESVRDAEAAIRAKVAELGGYVVKVETSGADANMTARITFRVPAAQFDTALAGTQGLAKKVLGRTVSGDDVTEEFVDLEARLRNLEATRDRLQSFLDKANTVEDALKVNQSLSEIQGQIEQLKGRKQFLQQSAALSTVSVALMSVPITPIVAEDGWQPLNVARGALRDLVSFGQAVANIVIVALVWTPLWLPLLLLGLWGRRKLRIGAKPSAPEAA